MNPGIPLAMLAMLLAVVAIVMSAMRDDDTGD